MVSSGQRERERECRWGREISDCTGRVCGVKCFLRGERDGLDRLSWARFWAGLFSLFFPSSFFLFFCFFYSVLNLFKCFKHIFFQTFNKFFFYLNMILKTIFGIILLFIHGLFIIYNKHLPLFK